MKNWLFVAGLLLPVLFLKAQKREEWFDYAFKPSKMGPYYYVVTEKKDTLWHRMAYYISQKSLAMEGWYKDDSCTFAHGPFSWYHTNRFQKSTGHYVNGKKEGVWLDFDEEGNMVDSANYVNGRLKGVEKKWYKNGMQSDSLVFDGAGNGAQVSWYDDGSPASGGYWTQDTVKRGRWKYYHHNGTVMATEDYVAGKKTACACFDESGRQLDSAACVEKEAEPGGGVKGWRRFLEQNLQRVVEAKARVLSPGQYTVVVRFIVEKDGTLSDFKPLTQYGHGLEEEVVSMLKRAPSWTPGQEYGKIVRSYHTQPITFVISN
jgi:antitoxin component YwqK of YwqJK toxin-antitoxin module